ncbi:MAG TPA: SDR family oxidoreductase [Anaeromyxobacteraceae bacterium]|jgi:uncharacterized protein YbjT (DUF2867 family)/uncharacterized protein YndB with AHSA1/START domain|nr:SDR family oxidoreductase [Anaeromyxobacteraceae bacterium]
MTPSTQRPTLVTGATGYVGGRLVPRLLAQGERVRVLAREPARLAGRPWAGEVEVVSGDVLNAETLPAALREVRVAYYLVHSMSGHRRFQERDLAAASNFGAAARAAGVERIIYLGGLGEGPALSPHLRSRQATGEALRRAGVPVTELRAGIVVGAGSISFEMMRYLTERLPVMVCPRWVYRRIQPIAIRDVLSYLLAALARPESAGATVEVGGADVLTYRDLMLGYARLRGLKRVLLPVPVLTPALSSRWVHVVTPIPASVARPLLEGLRADVVVRDDSARRLFPEVEPMGYEAALRLALDKLDRGETETSWSDPLVSSQGDIPPVQLTTDRGLVLERRQLKVAAPRAAVFRAFTGLGGARGWLYADWAWKLRGALDRLLGGVGFRRGRRHPDALRPGDALDFWRVEAVEPDRLLRLRAEMKMPGRAWLQFEANPIAGGEVLLTQTAFFAPRGLAGFLYWYALYPIHGLIFSNLVRRVGARAEALAAGEPG